MSQLIFAQAKSILRRADKAANYWRNMNNEQMAKEAHDTEIEVARKEFKRVLTLAKQLHEDYIDVMQQDTSNWYFITIRPDEKLIKFPEFFDKVKKYCNRTFMIEYTLSFEQKGTDDDNLGHGFHAHIVAKTKHRSKGECLRDTKSTFGTCTAPNCIQVDVSRTPENIIKKYLVDYESEDDHKIATKCADQKWREHWHIKHLYTNEDSWGNSPSIKSGQMGNFISIKEIT